MRIYLFHDFKLILRESLGRPLIGINTVHFEILKWILSENNTIELLEAIHCFF